MAQNIPYQNSGNRWVDDGPSFWDQSEFSDESRGQVQIWNIYPEQKQVTYWTRTKFSKRPSVAERDIPRIMPRQVGLLTQSLDDS